MPFYFPNPAQPTFDALLRSVVQDNGLATTDLLTADDFQQACEQLDVHFAPRATEIPERNQIVTNLLKKYPENYLRRLP